eukprot:104435-Rhodomonas_salina.1
MACPLGMYKPANGSGACVACEGGTYLNVTAGSRCAACPANTVSVMGSDEISDCICNVGFEGEDGLA